MMASKVQRGPRWLSLIASILGASNGMAPSCLDSCSKSFSSTKRNSAWGSTNRLISQGQATRSTLTSLRVIHFMFTSRSPGIREFDCKAIFVELWRIGRDQAGKTLACCVDHKEITVRTIVPAQPDVGAHGLVV